MTGEDSTEPVTIVRKRAHASFVYPASFKILNNQTPYETIIRVNENIKTHCINPDIVHVAHVDCRMYYFRRNENSANDKYPANVITGERG